MLFAWHDQVTDKVHQDDSALGVPTHLSDLSLQEFASLASNFAPFFENTRIVTASEVTMRQTGEVLSEDALFILFDHEAKIERQNVSIDLLLDKLEAPLKAIVCFLCTA